MSKGDTLRASENRIFTCEERAREERQEAEGEEEEEAPLHQLLENPAYLSILAFKDDRVDVKLQSLWNYHCESNGFSFGEEHA